MRDMELKAKMISTLWDARKYLTLSEIEKLSGAPVPEDCIGLIEKSFKYGAAFMFVQLEGERGK